MMIAFFATSLVLLQNKVDIEKVAPVTLEFQDRELREVIRELCHDREINYSIAAPVQADVWGSFNQTPFSRTLTLLLREADAGFRMENDILLVAPLHDIYTKGREPYLKMFYADRIGKQIKVQPEGLELKPNDIASNSYQWIQERARTANLSINSVMLCANKEAAFDKTGFAIAFPLLQVGNDGKPLRGTGRFNDVVRTAGLHYDLLASALDPPEPDVAAIIGVVACFNAESLQFMTEVNGIHHPSQKDAAWKGTPEVTFRFYQAVKRDDNLGFRWLKKGENGLNPEQFLMDLKLLKANEIKQKSL